MSDIVLVAIITGIFGVITAFVAAFTASSKTSVEMRVNQAVTNTKIDNLTSEVREHNNFAKRMPVVEEQIKRIDGRISDLEKKIVG